jgi:hypothetical protein
MAHNQLYAVVYGQAESLTSAWNEYLKELGSSEDVAKTPA